MGLIEKAKKSYKNATTEKTNFGSPEPREPLSAGLVNWMNDNQNDKKTKVYVIGLIVFVILIIGLIGWSFVRVYAPDETQTTEQTQSSTTSQASNGANYLTYFNNINSWRFLNGKQKEFANNLYSELIDVGVDKGATVYCYSDVTESGDIKIVYIKEANKSRCFQVQVKSDLSFTLKEVTEADLPNVKENEELKKQEEERAARKAQQEANDKSDKNDTVQATVDVTDTSNSIALTDSAKLKNFLPEDCVNMISDSLVNGMKDAYGFNAISDWSVIRPETVTQNGSNVTFMAQFVDQDHNVLNVEITYNQSDGNFSGKRVTS